MIDEMKTLLTEFTGPAGRMRCFAHIINLIAKTVIRQFDMPTAKDKAAASEVLNELRTLAGDIELEEMISQASKSKDGDKDDDDDDNDEGWINEREDMDQWELDELEADVQPVRKVLVKVRVTSSDVHSAPSNMLTNNCHRPTVAPQGVICDKKLNDHYPAKMVRDP